MFRFTLALMLLLTIISISPVFGQSGTRTLFDYLPLPDPNCSLTWTYRESFFDPLPANPNLSLVQLKTRLNTTSADEVIEICRLKLDIASAYDCLDSAQVADRYRTEAVASLRKYFRAHRTSECAFLVARGLKDKFESRIWYQQAIWINSDYYPAYFALVKNRFESGFEDTVTVRWIQRTQNLASRLLNSRLSPGLRADIAYQSAKMESDLMFGYGSTNLSGGAELNQKIGRRLCSQEIIDFYKKASELDPAKVQYRLRYLALELGQLFFSGMDFFYKRNYSTTSSIDDQQRIVLGLYHDRLLSVRSAMEAIPVAGQDRFPAVIFYLAIADYLLGDYERAYNEMVVYLNSQPDDQAASASYCAIMSMLSQGSSNNSVFLDELIAFDRRKCDAYPTGDDCYRLGFLKWYSGCPDTEEIVCAAFRKAALLNPKDLRPKFGLVACALKRHEVGEARAILKDLQTRSKEMNNNYLACLYTLNSILATENHDPSSYSEAIDWARKAADLGVQLPRSESLLQRLEH